MPTLMLSELSRNLGESSPFHSAASQGTPSSSSGVAGRLWRDEEVQASVMAALHHPFVRALALGSLPREAFQSYIAEDAFFLKSFGEGYSAAIQRCSTTQQDHLVRALGELLQGVQEELQLHDSYAAEWGVDLSKHQQPNPATRAYVDFLHSVAADPQQGVAAILAAMVPCLRLYAFLACQLARGFPFAEHEYTEWVRSYSSHEYLRLPAKAEAVLDETADREAYDKLLKLYRRAMELEVQFFGAQPYQAPPRPISLLVVDFDDTCTASDSTGLVMQTAIEATVAQADGSGVQAAVRSELQGQLQWLVANYSSRRQSLLEEILPEPDDDQPHEYDFAWLGDFIDRLSEFDKEMNGVVVESGILRGVKKGMLARAGASLSMQAGCLDLLRRATEEGIPTYVVSVNWSAEMVRAALAQQGLPVVVAEGEGCSATAVPPGSVVVYANELEYFGDTSTGNIKRRCECAGDKGRLLDDLLLDLAASGEGPSSGISVYIGDSMTDLPPLISADAGILVGTNDLVRQVAAVAGIEIKPLVSAPLDLSQQEPADEAPVLYAASSWSEISSFLFNPQFQRQHRRSTSIREYTPPPAVAEGKVPRVLAVAGSDSGGGAGIQADIKACMAAGVYSATAITALTAQNTQGVSAVHVAPVDFIRAQMAAVLGDIGADVVKTGMLPTPEVVEAVAEELQTRGLVKLVVDPVLVSTTGDALATAGVVEAIKQHLLPLATIVTPNLPEASKLLEGRTITDLDGMKAAAEELHRYGPQWVLIKGGHLISGADQGPPELEAELVRLESGTTDGQRMVTDVLFDGKNMMEISEPYISTNNNHGTGCSLASAIAAELAKGADVSTAVRRAKKYVWRTLERSRDLPLGTGNQKPMNHGWALADWSADLATAGAAAAEHEAADQLPSSSHAAEAAREQVEAAAARPNRIPNPCDLRVYAVTDPDCNAAHGRTNAEAVQLAVDGGATVVQLREKKIDGGPFMQEAAAVLEVCRSRGVPLLINDRVDVALAVGADGVHVGQDDLPAATVRRMIGPDRILGVSVKTTEQAVAAEAAGADYLGAGAVYPTGTKESEVIGLGRLAEICRAVSIPVVSIGGVKASNAAETITAGCAGAAVVSGVFNVENPTDACRELLAVVDAALSQRREQQQLQRQY